MTRMAMLLWTNKLGSDVAGYSTCLCICLLDSRHVFFVLDEAGVTR
jgi:hypothetical protein